MRSSRPVRTLLPVAALAILLGCTACVGPEPAEPSASVTTAPTPSETPTTTPTPEEPVLHPDGTAADNLPLFDAIVQAVWAGAEPVSGRAYIDALAAAGFDKTAMQVTADLTTIGNPVDTLEFSVRWGDECLIGQAGPEIGGTATVILPVLADGACLIGNTRPIDW